MANLTGSPKAFKNTLRKLETTDPKHPDTWNPNYQTLIDNDAYLKQFADEVVGARAGKANLSTRMDELATSVASQSEEADNNKVSVLLYALQLASLANSGVQNLREVAQQQGELLIENRGLVRGCDASKSTTATRNLNFTEGVCFAQGRTFSVRGTDNSASVPSNPSSAAVTVQAYLFQSSNGVWRPAVTPIGSSMPPGAIPMYQLTIPAGNTDATDPNLARVTLTSVRRFEPEFPLMLDSPPNQSVVIKVVNASDYQLTFDVVAAQGAPCGADAVAAHSRATNGFVVELHSAADNVRVRWKLSRLSN